MTDSVQARARDERRSKWWWTLVAIPPLVAVLTAQLAPEPHGHWTEHLSGAALKTAQLVLLLLLMWGVCRRTLRITLLVALGVVVVGIVMQVLGDYQVAESIWRRSGHPQFGDGYAEGHDRAALGDMFVLVGGLAFAVAAGVARLAPLWLAAVAALMVVIPPPFFWPAAGALVLMLYTLTSTYRERVTAQSGRPISELAIGT